MPVWVWYLIAINLIAFFAGALDKRKAKKGKWRIPEKTLLFLALLGGAVGLLFAMYTCRHKTHKPLFKFGVPLMLLLQIALLVFLLYK